jgi:hypothetical protein
MLNNNIISFKTKNFIGQPKRFLLVKIVFKQNTSAAQKKYVFIRPNKLFVQVLSNFDNKNTKTLKYRILPIIAGNERSYGQNCLKLKL